MKNRIDWAKKIGVSPQLVRNPKADHILAGNTYPEWIWKCWLSVLAVVVIVNGVCGELFPDSEAPLIQLSLNVLQVTKKKYLCTTSPLEQVWSLSSFKVSHQLFTNYLNQVSSVSLLLDFLDGPRQRRAFWADLPFVDMDRLVVIPRTYRGTKL